MSDNAPSTVKRALAEIRNLRARAEAAEGALHGRIAIVGMGLRLPGEVMDAESFADVLWGGIDTVGDIPAERWSLDKYFADDPDAPGKMTTRFGAFLRGVDEFDPAFFGISPREAASMDPQQRLLMELAWESLEDAVIAPDSLSGVRVGVYIGLGNCDYGRVIFPRRELIDTYFATGTSSSIAAGRIAYTLGLVGPAVTVDTACSSGLTAVHLACQALRLRECDAALAGAVNLILSPDMNVSFTKGRMMAADGRCKSFDATADGYVRGEGGVVLALKREADARASGDRILAIIRGTAINQDGRSNGITAPNGQAQEAVIRAALANANVRPDEIAYVETHGTGTPLGDPIELGALEAVFAPARLPDRPLLVGSVKTNIGHTEANAGLAGVAKAVLALQRGSIPPSLHFHTGNPHVDWVNSRIEVVAETRPFPSTPDGRRLAGVSAFGFSGTNAHIVLEADQPVILADKAVERPAHLLALSARDARGMRALAERWRTRIANGGEAANLCHTANVGRASLDRRVAVIGRSADELIAGLEAVRDGASHPAVALGEQAPGSVPKVAFLFTGQGLHFCGMGRDLYNTSPVFRSALDACAKVAAQHVDRDFLAPMFSDDPEAMDDPVIVQVASFALQVGLTALWRSWGVEPIAALGHSLGEYGAAYLAGIFSLDDAIRLVVARGRGAALCAGRGAMVAVSAPPSVIARGVREIDDLELAAFNGPQDFTVSGTPSAVAALASFVQAEGGRAKILAVPFGSHSRWVEPALVPLADALERAVFRPSRIALGANVTGTLAMSNEMSRPAYWLAQMRQPVRFAEGIEAVASLGVTHFVEIGPHPALCAAGVECLGDAVAWLPSMRREGATWTDLLQTLQRLYVDGVEVNWRGFDEGYSRRKLSAPTYPFQRARHWIDSEPVSTGASASEAWRRTCAASERQSAQGPLGLDVASYPAKWESLERLTMALTTTMLQDAGLFVRAERHSFAEIVSTLGVTAQYTALLRRWLQRLVSAGHLVDSGEVYSTSSVLRVADLKAMWGEVKSCFADNPQLFGYIRHCGNLAVDVITGRESPLETLFPEGSFDLAEDLYERSSTMLYINALAASAAAAFAAAKGRPLRVLEIGGGTGATTASVLPALGDCDCTYLFTDVSELFLDRAREKFVAFPNISFAKFNLDLDLHVQGYAEGQYDLIVSANAVHACTDISLTLERLRRLLAPGGVLALVESTTAFAWFDFTTSLIEGWRSHADDLRTDGPLLQAEAWAQAMRQAGFEEVGFWPRNTSAEALGQHLIVARAPGEFQVDAPAIAGEKNGASVREVDAAVLVKSIVDDVLIASAAEQLDIMRDFVRAQVMFVLRLPHDAPPNRHSRLMDLGLDSLMAVQLRNRLSRGLALPKPLPATVMFDHPTIEALATKLLARLLDVAGPPLDSIPQVTSAAPALRLEVAQMSDADIERLLAVRESNRR